VPPIPAQQLSLDPCLEQGDQVSVISSVEMTHDELRQLALAFLEQSNAGLLARCARVLDAGLLTEDWEAAIPANRFPLPPAFVPVCFVRRTQAYGAWITNPVTRRIDVICMLLDWPLPAAEPCGRTGIRVALELLDSVADFVKRGRLRKIVGTIFDDADSADRDELVVAVLDGFDPDDDEIAVLPVVAKLWTSDDAVVGAEYAAPLPAMFERGARCVVSADRAPRAPRRAAFEAALEAGDLATAWAELNDTGWTFAESVDAFERIAPRIDPAVAELVRAKSSTAHYAPLDGY
jgi:hypothetical protein